MLVRIRFYAQNKLGLSRASEIFQKVQRLIPGPSKRYPHYGCKSANESKEKK